jgi:hypothetical protein
MKVHTRWIRRSIALWAGLVVAWATVAVMEDLRFHEWLVPTLVATTVLALLCGIVLTVRFRTQDHRPFITVADLHRR